MLAILPSCIIKLNYDYLNLHVQGAIYSSHYESITRGENKGKLCSIILCPKIIIDFSSFLLISAFSLCTKKYAKGMCIKKKQP